MIHQTVAVQSEPSDPETKKSGEYCSLSFSVQIEEPPPVAYIREMRHRLFQDEDGVANCFPDMWFMWYCSGRSGITFSLQVVPSGTLGRTRYWKKIMP